MNGVQLGREMLNVFPTILIFEILLLLPVRLLLRFRCVCKEWCELIDSRLFKDTYLAIRRATDVDDQIVSLNRLCIQIPRKCDYIDPDDDDDDSVDDDDIGFRPPMGTLKYSLTGWYDDYESLARYASATAPAQLASDNFQIPGNYPDGIRIVGHENGVVCLFHQDSERSTRQVNHTPLLHGENWFDIKLVNPAIREIRKLSDPMFHLFGFCSNNDVGFKEYRTQRIGFGYDDVTHDYKVVLIVTVFEEDISSSYKFIGMVYYLSTNSWKILGDMSQLVSRPFVRNNCPESVFSHRSIHWCMASDTGDSKNDYWILVFDLTNELFREMPFPQHGWISYSIYDNFFMSPQLFMVDKSTIAVVYSTSTIEMTSDVPKIEVWVMKEYGDSESWTKQNSIDNLPFRNAMSFWKKDKLLIQSLDDNLICYDLFKERLDLDDDANLQIWALDFVTGHQSFVSVK